MRGILFSGIPNRKINYLYNALGQKVEKTVKNNTTVTTTNYISGFHYENDALKFFATAEGYVNHTLSQGISFYNYIYNYTDHLGNNRLSYTLNQTLGNVVIYEQNHYYPFGLKHEKYGVTAKQYIGDEDTGYYTGNVGLTGRYRRNEYQYKFQNKEWQDELNLNVYDFGARQYMPDIVRTTTLDPLAEKFYSLSPHSFLNNNPLYFIDPTGESSLGFDWKPDENGNLIAEKGDNTATLATYLSTTTQDVSNRFTLKSTGEKLPENHQFKEGAKVTLNNNATRAISRSNGGSVDEINSGKAKMDVKNDNYVCDDCAQMATNGEEITPQNATKYSQFPNPISSNPTPGFTQVDSFEGVAFNKGIASIGGEHTVSYYGTSNDGTVYVLSKDGRSAKPRVASLTSVIEAYNKDQQKQGRNINFTMDNVRYYKKNESN